MLCNVIFINTFYYPNRYEVNRLVNLQQALEFSRRHIKHRARNRFEEVVKEQEFFKRVRSNMKVVK